VRCVSQVDDRRRAVAEGALTVDAVSVVNCDLVAARARGRWAGRYVVELDNQGNTTAELRAVAVDPTHKLSFAVSPQHLRVAAGSRSLVALKARARRPTLLGKPRTCEFQFAFSPAAGPSGSHRSTNGSGVTARDVSFEQVSVMPRKLTLLVALVVAIGGIAGAALAILSATGNSMF
jgi:hypothetical protein